MNRQDTYEDQLTHLIINALKEDWGAGDISTLSTIPPDAEGQGRLLIKQEGILAGMAVAEKIFQTVQPGIQFRLLKKDGDPMRPGDIGFEVSGKIHTLLTAERVVLNCMQRMSGIATLTHTYVEKLKGTQTRLLDTRKTTPNFRLLEKEAVRIGGGHNHRFGLYDMIMLKDNHIDFCGGLKPAIEKAYQYVQQHAPHIAIEVETRNLKEVEEVLHIGKVDRIMFDNFPPALLQEAVRMVNRRFETEASGGINLGNIREYAETGVDFISSGSVIHQAVSLDMSLKAVIKP
jgi:nicotinate-nucleotide pyrophosphorylase (carboxylating)